MSHSDVPPAAPATAERHRVDTRTPPRVWLAALTLVSVTIVVVGGWLNADRALRDRQLRDVESHAADVSDGQMNAVRAWVDARRADAEYWATDTATIAAVRELMTIPTEELIDTTALDQLRTRVQPFLDLNGLAGFFVVGTDGTSLASARDSNIGTPNLVAQTHPEVFAAMLAGQAMVTPLQLTDIPLATDHDPNETMFAGAPIVFDGTTIGVFLLRLVPGDDLASILNGRQPHADHEVVAFDGFGVAITATHDVEPLEPLVLGSDALIDLVGSHPSGSAINTRLNDGDSEAIVSWQFDPTLGIGVAAALDAADEFATLEAQRRTYVTLAAALWLFAIGFAIALYALATHRSDTRDLAISEHRLRLLVGPSPDPVLRIGPDGSVIAINPAATTQLGIEPSDAGTRLDQLADRHPLVAELAERWPDLTRAFAPTVLERVDASRASGRRMYYRVRLVPMIENGAMTESLVVVTDTTDDVEREQRLESIALIDPLTDLPNRAAVNDRLKIALGQLRRPIDGAGGIALMMIDLDNFKTANDAFGHQAGDQILIAVGRALTDVLRTNDSVGRLGGDEFVLICERVADEAAADELASRVSRTLHELTVEIGETMVEISGSVGVAWTDSPLEPDELMLRADRAMLRAKANRGSDTHVADHDGVEDRLSDDGNLTRDLFGALDRNEFELHYQPIVDAFGRVESAEALLRWRHPRHGLLVPAQFLRELMESGFIGPVGRWVVRDAVAQARDWTDAGTPISVHVNLSPVELAAGAAEAVAAALDIAGLDPGTICVEITEHALQGNLLSPSSMSRLGEAGVEIALDDFGMGASSLSHLRQRPLHKIKLDRVFVHGIETDSSDRAILAGIIQIAHDLGLDVVAEGVETRTQLDWLIGAGCHLFQGWLFSPALRLDEFDPASRFSPINDVVPVG